MTVPPELARLELWVNGDRHQVAVAPRKTLADSLREDCGLTGTHLGCEHGVCGTCTVLVDDQPVRACLMFAIQAQGHRVETVESLSSDGKLNRLQKAFIDHHAIQCGFCTPGFLMLITGALRDKRQWDEDELRSLLSSNLCRCTGYQNILEAARTVLADDS